MSESQKESEKEISFPEKYRKDKVNEGLFNVGIGVVFIIWTIFDVAFAFFEEMWYFNIFFGILGIGFLVYGIIQLRTHRNDQK